MVNPYNNVYDFFTAHGICLRDAKTWRLTEAVEGQIHGLPSTHGLLLATDGIVCFILQHNKKVLFKGHLDWFEKWKHPNLKVSQQDNLITCLDGEILTVGTKIRYQKKVSMTVEMLKDLCNPSTLVTL
jgi:hypothetical protein